MGPTAVGKDALRRFGDPVTLRRLPSRPETSLRAALRVVARLEWRGGGGETHDRCAWRRCIGMSPMVARVSHAFILRTLHAVQQAAPKRNRGPTNECVGERASWVFVSCDSERARTSTRAHVRDASRFVATATCVCMVCCCTRTHIAVGFVSRTSRFECFRAQTRSVASLHVGLVSAAVVHCAVVRTVHGATHSLCAPTSRLSSRRREL